MKSWLLVIKKKLAAKDNLKKDLDKQKKFLMGDVEK